jgi:hypothetical protein
MSGAELSEKDVHKLVMNGFIEFKAGPGWQPVLYDFMLHNCLYFNHHDYEANLMSERCEQARLDYKKKLGELTNTWLDQSSWTQKQFYQAA